VVIATTQLKFLAPDGKSDYLNAMKQSPTESSVLKKLLENALTNKINDRDMFLKGIDYSYYYEENN